MRMVAGALLLVVAGIAAAASRPEAVSACQGRALEFEDAIGMSNGAIYAGRVTRAEKAGIGKTNLTIEIDLVVRGPAASRVRRAFAGHACDLIRVGQYGYIVRRIFDPEYPGLGRHDVFFSVSRSAARAALFAAGLPDTSSVPGAETEVPPSLPWAWPALVWATAFVLVFGVLRRPRDRAD